MPFQPPQRLRRILIIATVVYFTGFIWIFTHGWLFRLFNPLEWEMFFLERSYAEAMYDRWHFYGTSLLGLIMNWLFFLAAISSIYLAYNWVTEKNK